MFRGRSDQVGGQSDPIPAIGGQTDLDKLLREDRLIISNSSACA